MDSVTSTHSDVYWAQDFEVTVSDLTRIAQRITATEQAFDLLALTRRLVRGRLRHGPEASAPVPSARKGERSVRLWDPSGQWQVGDHAIVACWVRKKVHEPRVAEVVQVLRGSVDFSIPDTEKTPRFARTPADSDDARKWHTFVRRLVEDKRAAEQEKDQVDSIMLEYGDRVASKLLDALRDDERFVRLAGRWFLRQIAVQPEPTQISALAWAMLPLEDPVSTQDLLLLVSPPLPEGDIGLFGLYLVLRDRPDLFSNADPMQVPRWSLSAAPPPPYTAQHAAYDPQTYEMICLAGASLDMPAVQRLWHLGLLPAVASA